jgi:hypothetical protein
MHVPRVHDTSRHIPRRRLLGSLLAAGSFPAFADQAQDAGRAAGGLDISAADSLVVYIDMLRHVQTEVLQESVDGRNEAGASLTSVVREVVRILELLAAELAGTGADPVRQVAMLAETGRIIQASLLHGGGVSERAVHAAMLPGFAGSCRACAEYGVAQGHPAMTPRAWKLFEELRTLTPTLDRENTRAEAANVAFNDRWQDVRERLDQVRNALVRAAIDASVAGDLRKTSPEKSEEHREKAVSQIESGAELLRALPRQEASTPLPTRQALIELLEGARRWLRGANPASQLASARPGTLPSHTADGADQTVLRQVLNKYSPVATTLRTAWLYALIMPAWLAYGDQANRERLIRQVLRAFPSDPPANASADFVRELARLG